MLEFILGVILGAAGGWFLKQYYDRMMEGIK